MSGFLSENWKPTNQIKILEMVKSVLITELADSDFTDKTVFLTLDPDPEASTRDNVFMTISPNDGQFDQGELEGGGQEMCLENSAVIIAVYSKKQLDRIGEHEHILLGEGDGTKTRSILDLKRRILQIFTNRMLEDSADDTPILVNHMQPVHATRPQVNRQMNKADLGLIFSTDFVWDLT